MKLYEKALFDAFVWGQAIENRVQFLVGQSCSQPAGSQLSHRTAGL